MGRLARLAARLRGERGGINVTIGSASAVIVAVLAIGAGAVVIPTVTGGSGTTCTGADVTTGTFTSRVSAATAGDVLCLDTGNYGSWSGVSKAITVRAAAGQTPTLNMSNPGITTNLGGLVVDGMAGMRIECTQACGNFTVKNSTFAFLNDGGVGTVAYYSDGRTVTTPVTLGPGDTFNNFNGGAGNYPYVIQLWSNSTNMEIVGDTFGDCNGGPGGNSDGIRFGGAGTPEIHDNRFCAFTDSSSAHTDVMQWEAGDDSSPHIYDNIFDNTNGNIAETLGCTDSCVGAAIIENNVFKGPNTSAFWEVGGDFSGPVVRHNVFIDSTAASVGNKPGTTNGARWYDNVISNVGFDPSASITSLAIDHNLMPSQPAKTGVTYSANLLTGTVGSATYAGGDPWALTSWCLTGPSAALTGADDGSKIGLTAAAGC